jgi:glycosyltransferase involved in cell wall biosynthesis
MGANLFYITRSPVGSQPYPELLLPCLARNGWNLTIVAPDASSSILNQLLPFEARRIDLVQSSRETALQSEVALLKTLLCARFSNYDVIYVNSQSLSARAVIALAGPKFGKRIVYHNPDYYDPFRYPGYFAMEKAFARKSDLYVNNEFHRGEITRVSYRLSCPVLTAPPNLPAAWPIPARSAAIRNYLTGQVKDAFVLILHGTYGEIRMVPELFEALARLPGRFRLVMTGLDHRKAEVDLLLAKLGIAERVLRLPKVSFPELLAHTVNADAGVLLYENSDLGNFFTAPGRITEYLACGLPVLATNHTGLENLVLKYEIGVAVNSQVPSAIADGILRLEDASRSGNYHRKGMRGHFLSHFAFDHWEASVIECFEQLMKPESRMTSRRSSYPWMPAQ